MGANHTPAISRRGLFRLGAGGTIASALPAHARNFGCGFTHGVASGDPSQESVVVWTRYKSRTGADSRLTCEISDTPGFEAVRAGGEAVARAQADYCAKLTIDGLAPGRWYYYRFIAQDGTRSQVGRTRTLPDGALARFRIAVFSCSNLGFGWFNAYAHAASAGDFDLALHLGDYIYEYARGTYPSARELHPQRNLWPIGEAVHLADYRLRYATYRADPDLRRLHQLFPMICIWDDHEIANDSWVGGAENHDPSSEGDWIARKAAARRAHREWMPMRDEPFARYELGELATLFRLDTRLEGREKPFDYGEILAEAKDRPAARRALEEFRDSRWNDSQRQLLGQHQESWLFDGLKRSRAAGKRWQVLAQQVVMGRLSTPPSLAGLLDAGAPDFVRRRVGAAAMAGEVGLPANLDAWDGYPAARARLLEAALGADANLVVLSGDSHNAWAFELEHNGSVAGIEFAGHSVTSPGLEAYFGASDPARLAAALTANNPTLKWADTARRGYMVVELGEEKASSEYRFVEPIAARSDRLASVQRIESVSGGRGLAL